MAVQASTRKHIAIELREISIGFVKQGRRRSHQGGVEGYARTVDPQSLPYTNRNMFYLEWPIVDGDVRCIEKGSECPAPEIRSIYLRAN